MLTFPRHLRVNLGLNPVQSRTNHIPTQKSKIMTTQEIHSRLNHRAGKHIPIKHVQLLMARFEEIHGLPVNETNIEAFLRYAW